MYIKGQELQWTDILAPVVVFTTFASIVLFISVTLLNYVYVSKYDDITKLEEVSSGYVERLENYHKDPFLD